MSSAAEMGPDGQTGTVVPPRDETRYILITECLQNDFFLNRECRLYLGDHAALRMLVGVKAEVPERGGGRLAIAPEDLERGPLGVFLNAVFAERRANRGRGKLYIINIRDWHEPGAAYDQERRVYGSHCETGTWGAEYIDGLERFLDPADPSSDGSGEPHSYVEGKLRVCHVHADSVFDFRPRADSSQGDAQPVGKLPETELENILDILIQGRDHDVECADEILARGGTLAEVRELARKVEAERMQCGRVYVAVIGVYSDVKVLTLLGGLQARYNLPNLAVSDTLTISPTLERHIAGLDFASKVMQIEVVHGVNDLVRYLGGAPPLESESEIVDEDGFAQYQTFFKDKQSVLAYQSEKLQDYLVLTERRALNTYNWIKRSNLFLIAWGSVFLIATLVFAIWAAIDPGQVSWEIVAVTGGVGLIQLVTAFYTQPMKDLQKNLMNLTTYRMVLESHSLKMALARFHLTTPRTLRDVRSEDEATEAKLQVEVLEKELAAIEKADAVDYTALERLRIGPDEDARGNSKTAAEKESPASPGDGGENGPGTDGQPKPPVAATADEPGTAGSPG